MTGESLCQWQLLQGQEGSPQGHMEASELRLSHVVLSLLLRAPTTMEEKDELLRQCEAGVVEIWGGERETCPP